VLCAAGYICNRLSVVSSWHYRFLARNKGGIRGKDAMQLKPGANVCKDRYVKKEGENISCFIPGYEERLGMSKLSL
jgi:hypothetical protein